MDARRTRFAARSALAATVALLWAIVSVIAGSTARAGSPAPVDLGTAASFGVLAGTTVTNTGPTIVNGDLGVSPGDAVTGFPPGIVNGTIHQDDAVADQAQEDLTTAYNDAAGRTPCTSVPADLVGLTLTPGVYCGGALELSGTLTLDAQGDPNAVFIFQAASSLITASASNIVLINGANPCNVFWQVGSSATLGSNSTFVGTIMALTSITANAGATVEGRLLARNGAVTLNNNVINADQCGPVVTTPPPTTPPPTTPPPTTPPPTTPPPTTPPPTGPPPTTPPPTGPPPTTPPPTGPPPTPAPTVSPSPPGSPTPVTGAPIGLTALAGLWSISLGGAMLLASRRPVGAHLAPRTRGRTRRQHTPRSRSGRGR